MKKRSSLVKKAEKKAICLTCKHFFITYEPSHPYGCRGFGFKGRLYPFLAVKEASNEACRLFEERKTPNRGER